MRNLQALAPAGSMSRRSSELNGSQMGQGCVEYLRCKADHLKPVMGAINQCPVNRGSLTDPPSARGDNQASLEVMSKTKRGKRPIRGVLRVRWGPRSN